MSGVNPKQTQEDGEAGRSVDLVQVSVVLAVKSNDPSTINPDFLRHNSIVAADLPVQEPPLTTSAFSQILFKGGLAVKAYQQRIIFEQIGTALVEEDIRCIETAKRYLENVPQLSCSAVGINPVGIRKSPGMEREKVSKALIEEGSWAAFEGVDPEVHLKSIYHYEDKTIVLDIASRENNGGVPSGMIFQANIHRDIREINQRQATAKLLSILDFWREDLAGFRLLVDKFDSRRFRS